MTKEQSTPTEFRDPFVPGIQCMLLSELLHIKLNMHCPIWDLLFTLATNQGMLHPRNVSKYFENMLQTIGILEIVERSKLAITCQ